MSKLESALKKALEHYGEVRVEKFFRTNPRQDGTALVIDYPYLVAEIDDWNIVTIKAPNSPNPLFETQELEAEGETIEDVVEWACHVVEEALDGGPEDEPSGP